MSVFLPIHNSRLEVEVYGSDFLILKAPRDPNLQKIGQAIFNHQFNFVDEVIVTEVEILLKLNQHFSPAKIGLLTKIKSEEKQEVNTYFLPVYFKDHNDWKIVCTYTGQSKDQIIETLTNAPFSIAMFGFIPGFVYFNGLPKPLQVPRKKVPAKYIPPNSLAIGGKYLGLYSLPSPGGWQVIGQIPLSILRIPEVPPLAVRLGDQIRLQSISKDQFEALSQQSITLANYQNG